MTVTTYSHFRHDYRDVIIQEVMLTHQGFKRGLKVIKSDTDRTKYDRNLYKKIGDRTPILMTVEPRYLIKQRTPLKTLHV